MSPPTPEEFKVYMIDDVSFSVAGRHGPWPVEILFAVIDQRLECVGVLVGEEPPIESGSVTPLNHAAVRFPFTRYVDRAREAVIAYVEEQRMDVTVEWFMSDFKRTDTGEIILRGEPEDVAQEMAAELQQDLDNLIRFARSTGRKGRPPLALDHLQEVAAFYIVRSSGRSPTKDVADNWNVSHSAAAKWVFLARKAGLIPPVRPKAVGVAVRLPQATAKGTKENNQ